MTVLATIRNPFLTHAVPDPWARLEGDVPHIHQPVFELCHDLVEEVSHGSGSTCLLLYGEGGSGKTHILSRLRAHLEQHSEGVLVSVRLGTVAPLIWRHLRCAFANELLRETSAAGVTRLDGLLEKIGSIEEVKQKLGLSYGLSSVLTNFRENRFRSACAAWLRGDDLADSVIEKLELAGEETGDISPEERANQTVLQLCRMFSPSPVVFCFDQVEALETVPGDLSGLLAFGKAVADLHAELTNVVVISSMQASFAARLEEKLDRYIFDRLSLHRAELHPLSWRQGHEVLRKRLDSQPEIARLRSLESAKQAVNQPDEALWPLREAAMKQLFGQSDQCVARRLIYSAAEHFEAARGSKQMDARTTEEFLADEFAGRRECALANPPADAEELLLTGLPVLFDFLDDQAPEAEAEGAHPTGFDAVYEVVNQAQARAFAARLEKIEQDWNPDIDPPLVLIRDARLTVGSNLQKAREILDRLRGRGALLVQPSAEALGALEALRSLHGNAQSGNLVHRGNTVATGALAEWFSAHPPAVLEDFIEELKPKAAKDHFVSDLLDFLAMHSIVKLEEAAQAIRVPQQQLADYARHHPVQLGYLAGPPAVLFRAIPGGAGDPCEAD
ncbi:MAG TPA: AAA family ATPase [Bryobacteraceae bacterium]|jgi:hypothetical protein